MLRGRSPSSPIFQNVATDGRRWRSPGAPLPFRQCDPARRAETPPCGSSPKRGSIGVGAIRKVRPPPWQPRLKKFPGSTTCNGPWNWKPCSKVLGRYGHCTYCHKSDNALRCLHKLDSVTRNGDHRMTVQPQAASYVHTGTAMTAIERRGYASTSSHLRYNRRESYQETAASPAQSDTVSNPTVNRPAPSGDLRIDGYTLWAYSDVFKGLVLDIQL